MKKLSIRDVVATILVLAIAVPYIGYLINGEMPFIKDPRGMSAVGLLLGAAAFLVLRTGDQLDRAGKIESGVALAALALGLVALVFAETAAAELLLALFMGSILVVFVMELLDHSGVVHWHGGAPTHA
jgi:hypothetical protein